MAAAVSITLLGAKDLERKFMRLVDNKQRVLMRAELKKSAARLKPKIVAKVAGFNKDTTPFELRVHTGRLVDALKAAKVKAAKMSSTRRHGFIAAFYELPSRETYGLPPGYKWYPPFALEYGYTRTARNPVVVPAQSYIRSTVNANSRQELGKIRTGLARTIEKTFASGKGVR